MSKLKKWIELELSDMHKLRGNLIRTNDKYRADACKNYKDALEDILYIIENKSIWNDSRGHGVFKRK